MSTTFRQTFTVYIYFCTHFKMCRYICQLPGIQIIRAVRRRQASCVAAFNTMCNPVADAFLPIFIFDSPKRPEPSLYAL